ncbi:MAG: hypothetical protein JSU09_08005 [Bacteroidetes bacterium]|nr:hypothetical protein [Bacteroidota bacterium]
MPLQIGLKKRVLAGQNQSAWNGKSQIGIAIKPAWPRLLNKRGIFTSFNDSPKKYYALENMHLSLYISGYFYP